MRWKSHSEWVTHDFSRWIIYLFIYFVHAWHSRRLSRSMKFNSMSFDKPFFFSVFLHVSLSFPINTTRQSWFWKNEQQFKWSPLTNLNSHLDIIRLVASKSRRIWCRAPITALIWNAIHTCGSVTISKQFKCRLQVINWEKKWTDFL